MSLFIQKYGGTSVASTQRIEAVADHIIATHKQGNQLVVVVSAMGQHTDELKAKAFELSSQPPQRELDMLLSVGERVSMALLSIALAKRGGEAFSFTGSQCGILTTSIHGKALIIDIKPRRLTEKLSKNHLPIVAGFQGMSADTYEITTLGRGGSDLSAVALSKALSADRCEVYKDIDGVYNADPRIFSGARKYQTIDWMSCYLLCVYGADVLHDRACALAAKEKIPLHVRSSFELDKPGTLVEGRHSMENFKIVGITKQHNISVLRYNHKNHIVVDQQLQSIFEKSNARTLEQQDYLSKSTMYISKVIQGESFAADLSSKKVSSVVELESDLVSINIVGYHLEMCFAKMDVLVANKSVRSIFRNNQCVRILCDKVDYQSLYQELCTQYLE